MGKSSPQAPTPVDPVVAANAQSAADIATAAAQQKLNMSNTSSPYGSVTYSADPNAPSGYQQTTSLSPAEQALFNQYTGLQGQALGIAGSQVNAVKNALATPLSTAGLPSLQTVNPTGNIQTSYGQPVNLQSTFDTGGNIGSTYNAGGQVQNSIGSGGTIQNSFNQGQAVQGQAGPGDVNQSVQDATNAVWQQAMSRLQPQQGLQQSQLQQQLANQGVGVNSAAYQNAQGILGRNQNDATNQALYSAIGAGTTEQNVLAQQALQQGQFANSAAAQEYSQNQGQAAFNNQAVQQGLNSNLAQGNFSNSAQAQQNSQNAAALAAANAAQQQQYTQNLGSAAFGNQTQEAANSMAAQQAAFGNTAQEQQFSQQQSAAAANNAARSQGLQEAAYIQNQPINQLSALESMGQVQAPQAAPVPQTSVAPTDVLGAYALNQQQQQANYQAQLAQQNSLLGGLFNLGSSAAMIASDMRLKRDIRKVGTRPDGLGVYLFRYLWSDIQYLGLMAQEVLWVKPQAVGRIGPWLAVDYGRV